MTNMSFLKTLYKTFTSLILFRKQVEELLYMSLDFPSSSNGKESACSVGDLGSIPGLDNPLGRELATHSSILTWKIPWTEEPGELQFMELQTVRYD